MTYQWTAKVKRNGYVEYKLDCPLMSGEYRPIITGCISDGFIATAISGYTRKFDGAHLAEAKQWASVVPMERNGWIRERNGWERSHT